MGQQLDLGAQDGRDLLARTGHMMLRGVGQIGDHRPVALDRAGQELGKLLGPRRVDLERPFQARLLGLSLFKFGLGGGRDDACLDRGDDVRDFLLALRKLVLQPLAVRAAR